MHEKKEEREKSYCIITNIVLRLVYHNKEDK